MFCYCSGIWECVVVVLRDTQPITIPEAGTITSVSTYARGLPVIWNEVCRLLRFCSFNLQRVYFLKRGTEYSRAAAVIGRCAAIVVVHSTAPSPALTRSWVQQWRGRHWSQCSNWCRPLYGAQSRFDSELSAAVQGPSSVAMQQLLSSALRRPVPLWLATECSNEGAVIGRYAAIDVIRCTASVPLWLATECSSAGAVIGRYAAVDVVRSTAPSPFLTRNWVQQCMGPSSAAVQHFSYECGCRFC